MSEIPAPNQEQIAAEMHARALRANEEAKLEQAFEPGNQQSYEDWNNYLAQRSYQDGEGQVHGPNGQVINPDSDYDIDPVSYRSADEVSGTKRKSTGGTINTRIEQETLAETVNGYEDMSMSELAREMAKAEVANDKTKFAEIDGILSEKVEQFASGVKTERNPNGLTDDAREAMHARLRKLIDREKAKMAGAGGEQPQEPTEQPQEVPTEAPVTPEQPQPQAETVPQAEAAEKFLNDHPTVKEAYDKLREAQAEGDAVKIAMATDELNTAVYEADRKNYKTILEQLNKPAKTNEEKTQLYDQDADKTQFETNANKEFINSHQQLQVAVSQAIEAIKAKDQAATDEAESALEKAFEEISQQENWDEATRQARKAAIEKYILSQLGLGEKAAEEDQEKAPTEGEKTKKVETKEERSRWQNLKNRLGLLRHGDYKNALAHGEKKEAHEKNRRRRIVGAVALFGGGAILAYLNTKNGWIDINPFDGDGLDLNPFNNGDSGTTGGTTGAGPEAGPDLSALDTPAKEQAFKDFIGWVEGQKKEFPGITSEELMERWNRWFNNLNNGGTGLPHTL